ncbi:MAG: SAM-dependent methyltransferase, partial [Lachnospiraceae bacterium]|nr:SAM-dependent methyltransferase [Lachnospiraceae bacterium]
ASRPNPFQNPATHTQLHEFIEMENTPKNLLIRAVKKKQMRYKAGTQQLTELEKFLNVSPALEKLLNGE